MAYFIAFLRENKEVCPSLTVLSEARNNLATNKSKITKKLAVLERFPTNIVNERAKQSPNVDRINGDITGYSKV